MSKHHKHHNASVEGGTFKQEYEATLAPVVIEPEAEAPGEPMATAKVKITTLKVMTSAGSMREHWQVYLPEAEANALIAEGKAALCQ